MKLGTALIYWTTEEILKHNQHDLGNGQSLQITNWYDPNQWSLELATVALANESNKMIRPGDKVLVDFAIFTLGMFSELQLTTESRYVCYDPATDRHYFWCKDHTGTDSTEIFSIVLKEPSPVQFIEGKWSDSWYWVDEGHTFPALLPSPGLIIVSETREPPVTTGLIKPVELYERVQDKAVECTVCASYTEGISPGDTIWIKPESSVPIKFRKLPIEYVELHNILARKNPDFPLGLELIAYAEPE